MDECELYLQLWDQANAFSDQPSDRYLLSHRRALQFAPLFASTSVYGRLARSAASAILMKAISQQLDPIPLDDFLALDCELLLKAIMEESVNDEYQFQVAVLTLHQLYETAECQPREMVWRQFTPATLSKSLP